MPCIMQRVIFCWFKNKPQTQHPLTNLIWPKIFTWLWFVINLFFPSRVASTSFQWSSKTPPPTLLPPSFKSSPQSLLTGLPAEKAKLTFFSLLGPYPFQTRTCTELLRGSTGVYYAGIEREYKPVLLVFFLGSGGKMVFAGHSLLALCQAHASCCKCMVISLFLCERAYC